jgi:hypothetical protein
MPFCSPGLQFGLNIFHRLLKSRVLQNHFYMLAIDSPLQGQQVLGEHFGNRCAVFSRKNPGEIGEVLVQAYIDTRLGHDKPPLGFFPSYPRREQLSTNAEKCSLCFCAATFVEKADERRTMGLGASRFVVEPIEGEQFIQIRDDVLE